MSGTSRPLRAAGMVMLGWVVLRATMLTGSAPALTFQDDRKPPGARMTETADASPAPGHQLPSRVRSGTIVASLQGGPVARHVAYTRFATSTTAPGIDHPFIEAARLVQSGDLQSPYAPDRGPARQSGNSASSAPRNRFQLSAWALIRDPAASRGLVPGGTLGGSQIGARGWFEPGPEGLALTARVSSPLASRNGREASVGFGIRKRNFGVIVEERLPLDAGSRPRPSLTAFGGVSDVRLRGKLRLDAYAQAGIVGLQNRIDFADGALRIAHPLVGKSKRLFVGAGAWGGAQTGVTRLDVGPQLVTRLPVAGGALRVAGEWRFRVAGNADPGSGPTLSMGMDF